MNFDYYKILLLTVLFPIFLNAENRCLNFSSNQAIFTSTSKQKPLKQITLECWLNPAKFDKWSAPVSHIVDNYFDESGYAFAYVDGKLRFMLKTSHMRGDNWNNNPGMDIPLNQWCHIAGVYDGESIKFFYNGELKETKYVQGDIDWSQSPTHFCLGAFLDQNEQVYYRGQLDEVRLWNIARSGQEIRSTMDKSLTGTEEGLVAYYPMDEEGYIIKDRSTNHLDGRLLNATQENKQKSAALIRPRISSFQINNSSSFSIEWDIPDFFDFDHYVIDLAKDRNFQNRITRFYNQKVANNHITINDIQGGSPLYLRVKSYISNMGFSAYSEIYEINDFKTALNFNIISGNEKGKTSYQKVIDSNVLSGNYISIPAGSSQIGMEIKLLNLSSETIYPGEISIKGPKTKELKYEIGQSSDFFFSDMKPGKYQVHINWGQQKSNQSLTSNFTLVVNRNWYQEIWFYLFICIALTAGFVLFYKRFMVISRAKYLQLNDQHQLTKLETSGISKDEIEKLALQIENFVQENKPYLEPKLSLKLLAEKMNMPYFQLSKVLSEHFNQNFNDYINQYRVDEVIKRLKENKDNHLKLGALAYMCGFYSDSTFFRAFKKSTGMTPNQYQKKLNEDQGE